MNYDSLSPEEALTLASYEKIAVERAKIRSNALWWNAAYYHFSILAPAGYILDIGCAHGRDTFLFKQNIDYTYVGIDISPAVLTLARQFAPQSIFMRMNMHTLGFKPASFDGFWAAASLLHIPKYSISSVLAEIRRVMKSSAAGFIALKEGDSEKMITGNLRGDNRFYALYRLEEFEHILVNNRFEVIMASRDLREYNRNHADLNSVWLTFFVRTL